jgi:hypothetical protein
MNLHTSNPTDSPVDIALLDPTPPQRPFADRAPDESFLPRAVYTVPPTQPTSIRRSVLEEAITVVCGERETTYGGPEDSFAIIGSLWGCYLAAKYRSNPTVRAVDIKIEPVDVAIMMTLLKTARLATTGGKHRDSLVDAAGYIACAAECALK